MSCFFEVFFVVYISKPKDSLNKANIYVCTTNQEFLEARKEATE